MASSRCESNMWKIFGCRVSPQLHAKECPQLALPLKFPRTYIGENCGLTIGASERQVRG